MSFGNIGFPENGFSFQSSLFIETLDFVENHIAVCLEYEYQNHHEQWFRAYGNENWEFDKNGLMKKGLRVARIWK